MAMTDFNSQQSHNDEDWVDRMLAMGGNMTTRSYELTFLDKKNQAIIHNEKNVLMHVFDQSTIEVIDERYRARKASTRDWEAFVRLIGPWSQLTVKQREAVEDEVFERCEWLQKAEGELAEESAIIHSHCTQYVSERVQREQKIAAWKAELDAKQERQRRDRELRLKSTAEKTARRQAHIVSLMNRVADASFLPELRLQIVEHVVRSRMPYWPVIESDRLDTLAEKCFTWPKGVTETVRNTLRRTAEEVLFNVCIIKLQLTFPHPGIFAIPSPLLDNLQNIRRLVLEADIVLHDTYHRDLNRSIEGMSSLATLFPRLKVCVMIVLVQSHKAGDSTTFNNLFSHYRNLKYDTNSSKFVNVPLEESIVKIIASFIRVGPGSRNLVRLKLQGQPRDSEFLAPLSEVDDLVSTESEEERGEDLASENGVAPREWEEKRREATIVANAKRIFDQTMRAHLH